jgi:hypothetical protein
MVFSLTTHKITCLSVVKEATNHPWLGLNQATSNSWLGLIQATSNSWLQEVILVLLTKAMLGSTRKPFSEEV